jgi:hypothetical protein
MKKENTFFLVDKQFTPPKGHPLFANEGIKCLVEMAGNVGGRVAAGRAATTGKLL